MRYIIKYSSARRKFKKIFGQVNHFLITSIIGLDYISKNDVRCPRDLSTVWDPKDKQASISRSREYLLKMFLASAVDSLDSYFFMINRTPSILPEDLVTIFNDNKNSRSVSAKFMHIYNRYENVDHLSEYAALIALAIQWRNNLLHFNSDNSIDAKYIKILESSEQFYKENCCGLDVKIMIEHFHSRSSPTFKETTSLIYSIHKFVEIIDASLINDLDMNIFALKILLKSNKIDLKGIERERAIQKMISMLKMCGFYEDEFRGLSDQDFVEIYDEFMRGV